MQEIPNNLPNIEKLLMRIRSAEKSNAKEIRLTMKEAKEVVDELALVSGRLNKTVLEIHQKLEKLVQNSQVVDVKFDGGDF